MAMDTVIDHQRLIDAANRLEPLPTSVSKLAGLVASEDYDAKAVVEVVSYDVALTAQILRAANSAASGSSKTVSTVHDAVVRLGGGTVLALATSGAVRGGLKQHRDPTRDGFDMWRHAVAAALASELVRNATPLYVPASAMTAALLHDVGKLVLAKALSPHVLQLIAQVAEAEHLAPLDAEKAVLMTDHAALGAVAAEAWSLPEAIIEAVLLHHTPWEASSPLATVVCLADALAHASASEDPYAVPDSVTVGAVRALEIEPPTYAALVDGTIQKYAELAERFAV
ncbi:MAG TPA: HDOD domain-containing protein [Acidimicrobiales bacterium]|nr:HDOD domain-containing protein [Acidimicrobiales bacterium]